MADDGGPAFPFRSGSIIEGGMSLRDYFAAKAMAAIVGTYRATHDHGEDAERRYNTFSDREMLLDGGDGSAEVASDAYAIADAMLAARKQ